MDYYHHYKEMYEKEDWFPQYEPFIKIYAQHWNNLVKLYQKYQNLEEPPLLLCFPDKYQNQTTKLFIVGQETGNTKWMDEPGFIEKHIDSITHFMDQYYEMEIGCYTNVLFFKTIRWFEQALGIEKCNSLWSNLFKIDLRTHQEIEQDLFKYFNVLKEEINVANPDIVIFFTGNKYDEYMAKIFPGYTTHKIDNFQQKELCKVQHHQLPTKTFRTYHPQYLNRLGNEKKMEYLETILSEIKR